MPVGSRSKKGLDPGGLLPPLWPGPDGRKSHLLSRRPLRVLGSPRALPGEPSRTHPDVPGDAGCERYRPDRVRETGAGIPKDTKGPHSEEVKMSAPVFDAPTRYLPTE